MTAQTYSATPHRIEVVSTTSAKTQLLSLESEKLVKAYSVKNFNTQASSLR